MSEDTFEKSISNKYSNEKGPNMSKEKGGKGEKLRWYWRTIEFQNDITLENIERENYKEIN